MTLLILQNVPLEEKDRRLFDDVSNVPGSCGQAHQLFQRVAKQLCLKQLKM